MRFGFYNLVSLINTLLRFMDCSLTFRRKWEISNVLGLLPTSLLTHLHGYEKVD
jgi:hypothetical protein